MRVDLLAIDIEEVEAVDKVAQEAKNGSCKCDQGNGCAEEDADSEDCECLGIKVAVIEVVLLLTEPGLVVLVDFAAHVSQPGAKV